MKSLLLKLVLVLLVSGAASAALAAKDDGACPGPGCPDKKDDSGTSKG